MGWYQCHSAVIHSYSLRLLFSGSWAALGFQDSLFRKVTIPPPVGLPGWLLSSISSHQREAWHFSFPRSHQGRTISFSTSGMLSHLFSTFGAERMGCVCAHLLFLRPSRVVAIFPGSRNSLSSHLLVCYRASYNRGTARLSLTLSPLISPCHVSCCPRHNS